MKLGTSLCITGKIERVVYQNPDNGYAVLQFTPKETSLGKITVVGYFSNSILAGHVTFEGHWQHHPTHGQQFMASSLTPETSDVAAISEMLLMRQLEGIGQSFAQKLWDKFGDSLPTVLASHPEKIKEVAGIGKQRYEKILKSWQKYKSCHDAMVFLLSHQISMSNAIKICDKFPKETIETVQENPYGLIDIIEGIGFQTADNLARRLSFALDSPCRVAAGIHYTLAQATQYGHCGMEKDKLLWQTARLLQLKKEQVALILDEMVIEEKLIEDNVNHIPCIFSIMLYEQEHLIAAQLKGLMQTKSLHHAKRLQQSFEKSLEEEDFVFSEEQKEALEHAITEKVFIITGGPGVGKTTLVRALVKMFREAKMEIALAAPTGRAAKRLSEVTGMEAKTIHRLLEYDPYSQRFRFNTHFPLPYEVVILDEVSMMDVPLCAAILDAILLTSRLIMVGDADQLASVGPGDVLRSLLISKAIPCQRLKTIFRQKNESLIIENAHRINQGLMPILNAEGDQDFYWVNASDANSQQQKMLKILLERIPKRFGLEPQKVQVLSPTNDGALGVNTLNPLLQAALNPACSAKTEIKHRDRILREGDKVIQVVNDYEKNVFNGDIGRVEFIDPDEKKIEVVFDQQPVIYSAKEWDQLKLAYAITIHKSQGSEYPAVIIMFSMHQKMMLTRNLLYTAVSRGKSCVIGLSDKVALEHAIRTQTAATRINKLEDWLKDEAN